MEGTATLTATEVIDALVQAKTDEHAAAVRQIQLAVHWALLHPCRDDCPATSGGHPASVRPHPWPGLAPRWSTSTPPPPWPPPSVSRWTPPGCCSGDALELVYRLPRLWDLVVAGVVPVWRARQIARETHDLGLEAVAYADRLIMRGPGQDPPGRRREAGQRSPALLRPRPRGRRRGARARQARRLVPAGTQPRDHRHVDDPGHPRCRAVRPDHHPHRPRTRPARRHRATDVRRARAVGILADPQYALDLMSGREGAAPTTARRGDEPLPAPHPTRPHRPDRCRRRSRSSARSPPTCSPTGWPATRSPVPGSTSGRSSTSPTPTPTAPSTGTTHRRRCANTCMLRDAHCVFPGCRRDSRGCDLDHITAYLPMEDGGPPGQTHPRNLAPLCRHHHRLKTHTAWDYKALDGHGYLWTAPTGHQYEVHPASRRPTERPDRRA